MSFDRSPAGHVRSVLSSDEGGDRSPGGPRDQEAPDALRGQRTGGFVRWWAGVSVWQVKAGEAAPLGRGFCGKHTPHPGCFQHMEGLLGGDPV